MPPSEEDRHRPMAWPWFVGGLLFPVAGGILARWLPPEVADGLGFFVMFAAASAIVSGRAGYRTALPRNLAASAVGGLVAGLLEHVFHFTFRI